MNKLVLILVLTVVLLGSLAACSSQTSTTTQPAATTQAATATQSATTAQPVTTTESSPASSTTAQNPQDAELAQILNGKTLVAVYRYQDVDRYEQYLEKKLKNYNPDFELQGILLVDTLTDALLQLSSGKADVLEVMDFTGTYLSQHNADMKVLKYDAYNSSTHMLFRQAEQAQYEKVNTALKAMIDDGTVSKLTDEWVTNLTMDKVLTGGTMPVIDGAETLKVGLSGDAPPLDYVAADGTPGGFNVAVLSEISKRAGINIELVSVTGGGRFAALESGKIDAFLWHNAYIWGTMTMPKTTLTLGDQTLWITEPYLKAGASYIYIQK